MQLLGLWNYLPNRRQASTSYNTKSALMTAATILGLTRGPTMNQLPLLTVDDNPVNKPVSLHARRELTAV